MADLMILLLSLTNVLVTRWWLKWWLSYFSRCLAEHAAGPLLNVSLKWQLELLCLRLLTPSILQYTRPWCCIGILFAHGGQKRKERLGKSIMHSLSLNLIPVTTDCSNPHFHRLSWPWPGTDTEDDSSRMFIPTCMKILPLGTWNNSDKTSCALQRVIIPARIHLFMRHFKLIDSYQRSCITFISCCLEHCRTDEIPRVPIIQTELVYGHYPTYSWNKSFLQQVSLTFHVSYFPTIQHTHTSIRHHSLLSCCCRRTLLTFLFHLIMP